jgi:bcr-type benzoyl-CoA reductase subunit B
LGYNAYLLINDEYLLIQELPMSLAKNLRYHFMKDLGAPAVMRFSQATKKRRPRKPKPYFGPPLRSTQRLKEIMTRHYYLSRFAEGAKPVAWVTSGAPVELLRPFDFYTIYPENHGALCGAQNLASELCAVAEEHGYHQDLCSYARTDLGHYFSGKTPAGKLPKPDILFCSNNICQTVVYWYRALAHYLKVPLILFDTPYNFEEITENDISYMFRQFEEMIPILEQVSGQRLNYQKLQEVIRIARHSSFAWGEVLATMKARPAPMTIFDAFVHLAPIVSLRGLPVTLDYYRILLEELKERVERGVGAIKDERKRLMWDNIAIWYKVRDFSNLFAEHGMSFVAATYTNAWAETTPYMDENRPLESMVKAYSLVILNNNLNHRLKLMERLIKEYQVDGLVIHSARSCKPYSVGQYDLKRLLTERLGVPSVVIEADIADSRVYSDEQALTRLEAFFEAMQA